MPVFHLVAARMPAPLVDPASADLERIAWILLLATGVGFLGTRLRQPLIVSFLVVGILSGPFVFDLAHHGDTIELLSHIGVAILLFIVGLKLDLGSIRTMGSVALASGLGQVAFTSLGGVLIARALGMGWVEATYVAIALTFSSTIIIVKLLSDKREIDALHGRIAIGFLIVQDVVVILAMIALTAVGAGADSGEDASLVAEFGAVAVRGLGLVAGVLMLMRFVLPAFLRRVARSSELLVMFAIAWAVGLSVIGDLLGFSRELGAFLAGMSLATTRYRDAIGARLVSLRDFLLLFFFIHLGAGLDLDRLGASFGGAAVLSAFVLIGNPLIVMAILGWMGYRRRTGFLAGLTVAQISEFSLILIGLGATLGHVDQDTVGLVTLVGLITIGLSTYMILYSGPLYRVLGARLRLFERRVPFREIEPDADAAAGAGADVVVFGLGAFGGSIARRLLARGRRVAGVDFDPQRLAVWHDELPVVYGDAEDPELLEHVPVRGAHWIVVALPDREVTATLVGALRGLGVTAPIAVTARSERDSEAFARLDVQQVLRPYVDAAERAAELIAADAMIDRSAVSSESTPAVG